MRLVHCYPQIIADQNLWLAWKRFRAGKGHRVEVCVFERYLETNLLSLRAELINHSYNHGAYRSFVVHDPKRRLIHVPSVRDQVVHQAVWNILFSFFHKRFSPSVTSCRPHMGTSAARGIIRRWGKDRHTQFVLHMDVVKCFDSISHTRLQALLSKWIDCSDTSSLISKIISSYVSGDTDVRKGIPLGNLTSQLFCNMAFMEVDREMDSRFGVGAWVRYADDLFIAGPSRDCLRNASVFISSLLATEGLRQRSTIRSYQGFEALGSRWFYGGSESVARATRKRTIGLIYQRCASFVFGEHSQYSFSSSCRSVAGLAVYDRRWTKQLQKVILESI